jgi:hypothetical protein
MMSLEDSMKQVMANFAKIRLSPEQQARIDRLMDEARKLQAELDALEPKRWPCHAGHGSITVEPWDGEASADEIRIGFHYSNRSEYMFPSMPHALEAAIELGRKAGVTLIDLAKVVEWLQEHVDNYAALHLSDPGKGHALVMNSLKCRIRELEAGNVG